MFCKCKKSPFVCCCKIVLLKTTCSCISRFLNFLGNGSPIPQTFAENPEC